ncbi:NADPH-dependent FMN reductase [Alloactinosynnema sp. L-07]|uniref:NADPH-dependent FMN reductase n=1 Tax=Alloactinosynnema sp. L-07 TaxID=1653480 RepID=UPI0009EEA346|nr:NADPH-dependent FMN reductase [Alloactinosynnema sp. L-07]
MGILLVCGSLRAGSTNAAVLATAAALAPPSVRLTHYTGLADLPHFNPDDDAEPLHPAVTALRAALGEADGILFCTPEYAGALPGSFKNLLDWSVGGGETYGKPVAWINSAPRGAAKAHESLRTVLGYTGSLIIEDAVVSVHVSHGDVGPDGLVHDPDTRAAITAAVVALDQTTGAR